MESLDSVLNLTEEQKSFIKSRKAQFAESYETFSELISEMKETKNQLEMESGVL